VSLGHSPLTTAAAEPARLEALDGLRGFAIFAVVAFHAMFLDPALLGAARPAPTDAYPTVALLGWCGVDVFFVLSGFLITGILLRSKGAPGYFRNFYARRALRIFPLYYLVVGLLLFALDRPATTGAEKASYLLYYQNIRYALVGEGTFDPARLITWSLAIEEQFYLVWPTVVWLCSRRALLRVCVAVVVGAIALRFWLLAGGLHTTHFLTPCRLDTLAAGALLALFPAPPRWFGVTCAWLGFGGLLAIARQAGNPFPESIPMQRWGLLVALVFAVGLLTLARQPGVVAAAFRCAPLRALGQVSYCVYLVHFLVLDALTRGVLALPDGAKQAIAGALPPQAIAALLGLLCLGGSWLVAAISWRLFEAPILRLKRFFPSGG
jgi:peptidoglycan/LPS O-acetylase OafA/YrhL